MPNIKYSDGKQWINVHTTFKATETTHGVAKIATSDEVMEGLNDESYVTPKKLKEVVETLPVESEVVHKEGEEVITGLKTFSGNDEGTGKVIINSTDLGIADEVDSTPQFGEVDFTDKDSNLVGSLDTIRGIDDGKSYNAIRLSSANSDGVSAHTPLELRTYDDGEVVAVAPTPSEDANGIEVVTAEWIQPKLKTIVDERVAEDERLAGLIATETSERTAADASLQEQITKEIEDRTTADAGLQEQITTNLNSINDINQDIVEINEVLATKQDQLTEKQLAAVNSGVTEATVTQVATNVSNILDLQNKKADITYVDGEVDKLEQSITTNVNTINDRIDSEVETLNTTITTKENELKESISTNVNTLNTRIDNEVNTLNTRIDGEVLTINTELNKKADKADTYTKAEVDAKVSSVYRYKGSVENVEALPMEGNVEGDVYNVKSTGENFAWVAPSGDVAGFWDDIGGDIDLTPYLTKEEAASTYETIANVSALSQSVDTRVAQLQANIDTKVAQTEYDAKVKEIEQSITDNVNTINERIDDEVETLNTTITTKESALNTRIDNEVSTLNTRIDSEVETLNTTITTKENELKESITSNVNTLNTRIDTEVSTLNTRIDNEVKDLEDAIALKADKTYVDSEVEALEKSITDNVNTINDRIDDEVETLNTTITTEVATINGRIDSEVEALEQAIDLKADKETTYTKTEVDNLLSPKADITYVDAQIDIVEQSITDNVESINNRIDNEVLTLNNAIALKADKTYVDEQDTAIGTRIDEEVEALEQAIDLKADITYVDGEVDKLEQSITDNVNTINDRIDSEVKDLEDAIALKADKTYVDTELAKKADKETTYTKTEVDALVEPKADKTYVDGEVDKLEQAIDLKADKSSIGDATITFQKNGVEVGKFTTNQSTNDTLNIEVATKVSELTNDSKYQTEEEVEAVATELRGLITAEETARGNADNNLQTQIDAINARRDVIDILATYEELATYPTTDLTDKDIVKIIDDSSHNNTSSYFRWDATTSEWGYVGSEAATYTKAESDEKYALKTTTINGKSLEANVTLTYSDVNALSDTTKYAKSLEASGRTVTLKDQDGTVLSTITTQDTTYTAGDGIEIDENNKIINTRVSAVWGNIEGNIADQDDLVAEFDKKADKSTTYTKTEVDNLLSPKATTEYVDGEVDKLEQAIDLKADKSTTYTKTEVDNLVSPKADKTYVDEELVKKADKETTYTKEEIDAKGYLTEVPSEYITETELEAKGYLTEHQDISGKADITYVDGEVDKLEQSITTNVNTINQALDLKADKTEIPTKVSELENDAGYLTAHQDISGKADKTYVDEELAKKADKETTYTKTEVDALVEPKADKTYVDTELAKKASITYVDGEIDKVEEVLATKATKSNSLAGYGIADAYTKEEVNALIEDFEALPDQNGNANKALVTNGTEASWQYTTLFKNIDEGTEVGSSQLVINKLSQEKYDELFASGQISDEELYITVDDREFYTKEEVNQALDSKVDVDTHNSAVQQLQANIDLKADKSDTYTKAEVDAKVSSVYKFKGNVATVDALPTEGNVVGDVYNVEDTGDNYAWTEAGWDKLSGTIDLTSYLTKTEASTTYETIANVNTLKETVNTKANASDVYTKTEVNDLLDNVQVDLSEYAKIVDVNTELNKKADKATTLEGYGIEDITNINTSKMVDNNGKMVSNLTINETETILTSANLTTTLQGGQYIDISAPKGETLYKFVCHPMMEANMGVAVCNDAYTTTNVFEYEGIDVNRLNEYEMVDNPVSELYSVKLPEHLISYLVPCYKEDKTQLTLKESLSDGFYQFVNAPDLSDESKNAILSSFTGGFASPDTPIYFIRMEGVPNDNGTTGGLVAVYTDVNGDYIVGILGVWSIEVAGEISVGGGGNTLVIDWNESAIKKFEEIDALPKQQGNEGKFLTTDGTSASWNKVYAGVIRVWE